MRAFLKFALSFVLATGLAPAAAFAAPATADDSSQRTATAGIFTAAALETTDSADAVDASTSSVAPSADDLTSPDAPNADNSTSSGAQSADNSTGSDAPSADDTTGSDTPSADDPGDSDDPEAEAPEPVDPNVSQVTATVSDDEKIVKITASGGEFRTAGAVTFKVWPERRGEGSLIEYGAKQQADGTWLTTAFIAPDHQLGPGLPYSARIPNAVYRLYNPYASLHLVTTDANEADYLSRIGWNYENIPWVTPSADSPTAKPVYRGYNPSTQEHHYTTSRTEYDVMAKNGWQQEGASFISDPAAAVEVYRLYNPTEDRHLYTTDMNEYNVLGQRGWNREGVAFYGDEINADGSWSATSHGRSHCTAGDYMIEAYVTPASETDAPETDAPEADAPETDAPETTAESDAVAPDDDAPESDADEPADAPDAGEPADPAPVATATFAISAPTAVAAIGAINNAGGTFEVVFSQISSKSGIGKIYAPTWIRNGDRNDLRWYEGSPASDGRYIATVDARNHNLALNYHTDAYVCGENGVMACVAGLDCDLTLANFAEVTGGPYQYYVRLYNAGYVDSVVAYVWSEEGGQDDMRAYDAVGEGNGWWTATVQTPNLRHAGNVIAHIYAGGTIRNHLSFTVQPWELVEQKYFNMNMKVNDLASPSRYLLAVDTWNCFVGVYEGSRGNWRNIAYWPCTPGAPWSPTVKGLFSVTSRGYVFGHGYSCYYWTQFYGDYLFHSILYNPGTFSVQDGTMGTQASHGCVRLWLENAKWIYDNIPNGTTVLTY